MTTNIDTTREYERFCNSIGRLLALNGANANEVDEFTQRHALGAQPTTLIQSGWAEALNHLRAREQGRPQ